MRQAYSDRMLLSDAIERVGEMLDRCPHGRPKNEGAYIGGLANVICQYPRMVAVKCVDPINGVLRECEYLPTIAKLVAFCERESEFLRHAVERENLHDSRLRDQQRRAKEAAQQAEARKDRPTYADLKAKYGGFSGEFGARANDTMLRREYAAAGEEPVDAGHGIAVSRELSLQLRDQAERLAGARARNRMESARMIGAEADALAEKAAAE